jgi:NADPH:quinone reductase
MKQLNLGAPMRAVRCRRWGGTADLSIEHIDPPELTSGSVRIAVRAAGINFADTLIIAGQYQTRPSLPFTPGFEVAGEVVACAADVTRCRPGDRVLAVVNYGGFAEEVVAPESDVYGLPDAVDDITAAGFPIAYGTSHFGLKYKANLAAGDVLLVHGAAGGVGLTAVEIGRCLGASVIATAGGAAKLQVAAEYGAEHLIDYRTEDIREKVKEITGGRGADVVYDPVGGNVFDASLRCTAAGGRILVVGFASGTVPQIPANILLVKNLTVIGYSWGPHRELAPELMRASFAELLAWLAEGKIRPHVSRTFPLEQARQALDELRARRSTGKIVLTVGS